MERLRIAKEFGHNQAGKQNKMGMDTLSYVQVDDNGRIIAVFDDNTTMDVTELFSTSMINDYKNHNILVRC